MVSTLKEIFVKYVSQLLILVTLAAVVVFFYSKYRDAKEQRRFTALIGTQEKYKQLTKYTARLENRYQKEEELLVKSKKEWDQALKDKDDRIKLLSDVTYLIGKHANKQNGPDYYFSTPKHTRNFVLDEFRVAGKDSPPLGYILIKNDGTTYKRNYRFEILVKTMQTVDENNGKIKVYSKAFLVNKEGGLAVKRDKKLKNWQDLRYPLPIVGGVSYIDPTEKEYDEHLFWWAPHINGGISVGADGSGLFFKPTVDFSVSGYGKTKNDLDWKFAHFGLDSDAKFKDIGIHVLPFSYRFFPKFLTNTYIGPGIGFDRAGMDYQLNINTSF